MDIIGTRGFKGKKAKNAMSQFNSLFEVVNDELDEHAEEFTEEEQQQLDHLEQGIK
jgi:hypothetical protein